MWEREKDVPKQVEVDTPADTQTTTQVVKRNADDLGKQSRYKKTKRRNKLYKEGW